MAKIGRIKIPSRLIRIDKTSGTLAMQNRKTGRMEGRVFVGGKGDTTRLRRALKNIDFNHDGKIDFYRGQTLGRTKKIRVKSSRRARGYVREI